MQHGRRKLSARKFRRWVNHEVLPSIQRTGSYTVGRPEEPRDARLARHLVEGGLRQKSCPPGQNLL